MLIELEKMKQEECKFEASLVYSRRSRPFSYTHRERLSLTTTKHELLLNQGKHSKNSS